MSEPEAKPEGDRAMLSRDLPRREASARMALMAVGLVFLVGLIIGFVLGRTI